MFGNALATKDATELTQVLGFKKAPRWSEKS